MDSDNHLCKSKKYWLTTIMIAIPQPLAWNLATISND